MLPFPTFIPSSWKVLRHQTQQKQEIWDRIGIFAEPLLFCLESDDDGCNGFCRRSSKSGFKSRANFSGRVSQTYISGPQRYQALVDAFNDKADTVQLQCWQFSLAVTPVHELAHAAQKALRRSHS